MSEILKPTEVSVHKKYRLDLSLHFPSEEGLGWAGEWRRTGFFLHREVIYERVLKGSIMYFSDFQEK